VERGCAQEGSGKALEKSIREDIDQETGLKKNSHKEKGQKVMSQRRPEECENMDDIRAEIDRLDAQLVALIAERFCYVDRAWQFKTTPSDATVPWRIQQVIEKVRAHAEGTRLPPEMVEALWRQMIGWFVQYEESKLEESRRSDDS